MKEIFKEKWKSCSTNTLEYLDLVWIGQGVLLRPGNLILQRFWQKKVLTLRDFSQKIGLQFLIWKENPDPYHKVLVKERFTRAAHLCMSLYVNNCLPCADNMYIVPCLGLVLVALKRAIHILKTVLGQLNKSRSHSLKIGCSQRPGLIQFSIEKIGKNYNRNLPYFTCNFPLALIKQCYHFNHVNNYYWNKS